ncbi:MAG: hypothetical protein JWR42_13 [Marmoricola sp.]|nr:hypothetical protein [Marmoricola sp.]
MVTMTDLLSRPAESSRSSRPRGERRPAHGGSWRRLGAQVLGPSVGRLLGRPPEDVPERPLVLAAGLAGLAAAVTTMVACMVLALVGWYSADAGAHGTTNDALRVGADLWLVGHGSGLRLGGVPVGLVPLSLTALLAWVVWRSARRAGRSSEATEDRAVFVAAGVLTGVYLVVAVVTCVAVTSDAASPGLGRTVVGALLVAGLPGVLGLASGTDRLGPWIDRVPGWIRAVASGAVFTVRLLLLASLLLVVASLVLHAGDVTALFQRLGMGAGDVTVYAVACLALAPNAVLLGGSYLLGPGFSVGTGTIVSPGAVALGPLPAFPLLAALPPAGPTPSWAGAVMVVPVLAAIVGAVRSQRAYAVTAYDSAALRGFGGGFVAALATTVLVALAGGPMGTGRLADIGASAGEVLVAAVASMSLAGLVAGLATALVQRRAASRASAPSSRRGPGSR